MKTIEERAIEWVDSQSAGSVHPYNRQAMVAAYVAVYRELTQWHDPKEVISEPNHIVLTKWKYKDGSGEIISVGGFNGEEWDAHAIINPELFDIIGWEWPFKSEIKWNDEECGFNTPIWGDMDSTHYYNVLGNIHDNPDLLKTE